jgi:hypothetical protein
VAADVSSIGFWASAFLAEAGDTAPIKAASEPAKITCAMRM